MTKDLDRLCTARKACVDHFFRRNHLQVGGPLCVHIGFGHGNFYHPLRMEARRPIFPEGKLCKVHDPFPAHGHPRSRALERIQPPNRYAAPVSAMGLYWVVSFGLEYL